MPLCGVAVINTTNWKLLQSISLIGHPEAMGVEQNGSKLFVNVPVGNYVAVLDKTNGQVLGNFPIMNATGVFPMAFDEAHHVQASEYGRNALGHAVATLSTHGAVSPDAVTALAERYEGWIYR